MASRPMPSAFDGTHCAPRLSALELYGETLALQGALKAIQRGKRAGSEDQGYGVESVHMK